MICGLPIYEYDHMPGFANVKRHRANEITLLCRQHHGMKTNGLITEDQVKDANRNPFNLQSGSSSPLSVMFNGDSPEIILGEQTFTCDDGRRPTVMVPVMIDRQVPFGFTLDANGLLLNLDARNSKNQPVLQIKDSELAVATSAWDATMVGSKLSIWNEARDICLELDFQPPNRIVLQKYDIKINGKSLGISPKGVVIKGQDVPAITLSGGGTVSANVGMLVGEHPRGLSVGIKVG